MPSSATETEVRSPAPPPPKTPTPEQVKRARVLRNLIMTALETAFDVEKERYRGDGSDEKVAAGLGCSEQLVAKIRTEFFGDKNVNEAAAQNNESVRELLDATVRLKDEALSIATRAEDIERAARKFLGVDRP